VNSNFAVRMGDSAEVVGNRIEGTSPSKDPGDLLA
jgi:hypothetical protein